MFIYGIGALTEDFAVSLVTELGHASLYLHQLRCPVWGLAGGRNLPKTTQGKLSPTAHTFESNVNSFQWLGHLPTASLRICMSLRSGMILVPFINTWNKLPFCGLDWASSYVDIGRGYYISYFYTYIPSVISKFTNHTCVAYPLQVISVRALYQTSHDQNK